MIEYTYPNNPDDRIIQRAVQILEQGGVVAYPTDSSWALGCSSESSKGLDRLSSLREDKRTKFSLICSSISEMSQYAIMDTPTFRFVKSLTPGPFVFILQTIHKIEKKIGIKRVEVGLRIPDHQVPLRLASLLGCPIFSLTASKDMSDIYSIEDEYTEELLFQEAWELDVLDGVDMIIDTGETLERSLSTVFRISSAGVEVVRQGKGSFDPSLLG